MWEPALKRPPLTPEMFKYLVSGLTGWNLVLSEYPVLYCRVAPATLQKSHSPGVVPELDDRWNGGGTLGVRNSSPISPITSVQVMSRMGFRVLFSLEAGIKRQMLSDQCATNPVPSVIVISRRSTSLATRVQLNLIPRQHFNHVISENQSWEFFASKRGALGP